MKPTTRIYTGDALDLLRQLPSRLVDCVVTSPPYWGLRDYGCAGQIGLEPSPQQWVKNLVAVFEEVARVMRPSGTLWLNVGDSYASNSGGYDELGSRGVTAWPSIGKSRMRAIPKDRHRTSAAMLAPKNLIGLPWRLAFALQDAGWILRCDIIWEKPSVMPESVQDRPTRSHEYLFLLTRNRRYHYDQAAIMEAVTGGAHPRRADRPKGWDDGPGSHRARNWAKPGVHPKAVGPNSRERVDRVPRTRTKQNADFCGAVVDLVAVRNKRSVWRIGSSPFRGAHFATFPPGLVVPCVRAGSRPGGLVMDPFFGAGTTGLVSMREGRSCIGIELSPAYVEMAADRLRKDGHGSVVVPSSAFELIAA